MRHKRHDLIQRAVSGSIYEFSGVISGIGSSFALDIGS